MPNQMTDSMVYVDNYDSLEGDANLFLQIVKKSWESPEALSYGEAAEILSKEVGKKISYVNIPEQAERKRLKEVGIDDWFINSMMELYAIVSAGYASNLSSAVEELTGNKPISFLQFARDNFGSFKQ